MNSSSTSKELEATIPPGLCLGPRELDIAFPFNFILDREARSVRAGPAIRRLLPDFAGGGKLDRTFRIKRPAISADFHELCEHGDQLFLLEARSPGKLTLKGQMLHLPQANVIVFLGAPWLTENADIGALGLFLKDFAIYDSTPDYLYFMRAQKTSLADAEAMAEQLSTLNRQLERRIEERTCEIVAANKELQLYATVFDSVDNAVVVTDALNNIIATNPAFTIITGYSAAEVLGKNPRMFSSGMHPPAFYREMWETLTTTGKWHGEMWNLRKNGEIYVESVFISLIHDEKNNLTHHVAVFSDISKRKAAEEALRAKEALLQAILDNTPVGIWLVGADKRYRFVNKTFCDAVGITESRFLAAIRLSDLLGEEIAANCLKSDHECLEKETPHLSHEALPFVDGRQHLLEITKTRLRDYAGETIGALGIAIDITERKEYEEELKRSNAELEQFSYAISHDMRQPLRMISSYLQLLEMGLADQLDSEKRGYLNFAVEGAKRIDQMLVALLEYSRVGTKGEPTAWIESCAVLDEALQFLQPALGEAQAKLTIGGDWPRILASHDEMLRLIQNLIGNAVKYRITGYTPEITVTSEVVKDEWHLCVADNGVGIIPDQIKRLFQVFQRLQSREAYEGTGVGLALCRKIVEHHKGRIWAESAGEGLGSKFCVVLPVLRDETLSAKGKTA